MRDRFVKGCISILLHVVILSFGLAFNVPLLHSQDIPFCDEYQSVILRAMKKELARSGEKIRMEDYDPPYFISYSIRETETVSIWGKLGTVVSSDRGKKRSVYVNVRVGDYDMDNTDVNAEGFGFGSSQRIHGSLYSLPIDNDEMAVRNVLWYLTDLKYKSALENYLKKKGRLVFEVIADTIPDFSRENSYRHHDPNIPFHVDVPVWEGIVRTVSGCIGKIPEVLESSAEFKGKKEVIYFINSEGTEVVTEQTFFSFNVEVMAKSDDGMPVDNFRSYHSRVYDEMPKQDSILADVVTMVDELIELREAEELQPYVGPAILGPRVVGVIFHEAVGHRLEGERQRKKNSQQTFKGKIGQKIIPDFLSLIDDPTLERWNNTTLFGHYKYDQEGIPAQRVVLIDHGILKNYMMSRTPIKEFRQSNGHGRSDGSPFQGGPVGRMGVTFVKAEKETSCDSLKILLIEECRKQGKPYGLIIRRVRGGETSTHSWGYQAFKETPVLVYKVDVTTGEEKLMRGVDIVGTPLSSINKIVAASDDYSVFNGYCGAESGYIPVSAIAPSVLTQEVEMQKSSARKSKPPILPPPFLEKTADE